MESVTHQLYDYGSAIVIVCTGLYNFLPPWDQFADWPRFQSFYKFLMLFIKGGSGNFRSTLHKDIQATSNAIGTESK